MAREKKFGCFGQRRREFKPLLFTCFDGSIKLPFYYYNILPLSTVHLHSVASRCVCLYSPSSFCCFVMCVLVCAAQVVKMANLVLCRTLCCAYTHRTMRFTVARSSGVAISRVWM